jgi:16S rRNA (cytosine967-C5)-methyltransferase
MTLLAWLKDQPLKILSRSTFANETDYGLYRNLVGSVVRHYRRFLFWIEILTARSVDKLDPEALVCLLLGLVQLEASSRIKPHAAVNETVKLIAALGRPRLKGFINANLRQFSRSQTELIRKLASQSIAIQTSHSDWMVERWRRQYGEMATRRMCEANNGLPPLRLVLNPKFDHQRIVRDLRQQGYIVDELENEGLAINNPNGLFATDWSKQGAFLIQDTSSQWLNRLLSPLPKKRVLDACAAPGGKLIHLEWSYGDQIEELIAIDNAIGRIGRLGENVRKMGSQAAIVVTDATNPALKGFFDLVMVDSPCSSTGTIQKHPEIKWRRQVSDFLRNQRIQLAILEGIRSLVKPGGFLLYITCSLEPEENQAVIQLFLSKHGSVFRHVPFSAEIGERQLQTPEGFFQCLPSRCNMGMFAGLLQRECAA